LRGNLRRLGTGFSSPNGSLTEWVTAQIWVAKGGIGSFITGSMAEPKYKSFVATTANESLIGSSEKYREIQKR
jgi:hypothetical protein